MKKKEFKMLLLMCMVGVISGHIVVHAEDKTFVNNVDENVVGEAMVEIKDGWIEEEDLSLIHI